MAYREHHLGVRDGDELARGQNRQRTEDISVGVMGSLLSDSINPRKWQKTGSFPHVPQMGHDQRRSIYRGAQTGSRGNWLRKQAGVPPAADLPAYASGTFPVPFDVSVTHRFP